MNDNFDGKVAIITGGGSGIGLATAVELARLGAQITIVDCKPAAVEVVQALADGGHKAIFCAADVSVEADVIGYVAATLDAFGPADILVNSAGIEGDVAPITDYSPDAFDRVMAINVKGVFLGMKHVLPHLLRQGSGAIVNMSSVAGLVGAPGLAAYAAAKHAVIGLTRSAAGEVGRQGVRVNAICPGPIDTPMMSSIERQSAPDAPDEVRARNVARNPLGRYGEAEEVARVAVFLASDAASYVNGAAWSVDGGRVSI